MDTVEAAVSQRGDAVIGWVDSHQLQSGTHDRVLVARRPAGGTFGAPVELKLDGRDFRDMVLGMQGDGTTVALVQEAARLVAMTAAPGAPFGPPQLLTANLEDRPRLAVAPDGRALAVVPERDLRSRIFERPPGGAFAPVATIRLADTLFGGITLALRPDGAATVAYRDDSAQVHVLWRDRPGGFHAPEKVGPTPVDQVATDFPDDSEELPGDLGGRDMRLAFAPDGRPVLTWSPAQRTGPLSWADAAVTTLRGGVQTLGSPLRDADSIVPVMLADGTPAVVWSDVAAGGDPHLHLAIEGAVTAREPAAPRIRLGRVEQIHRGLALPFRCSAACDVRAAVPGGPGGRRSLRAAGSGRLTIRPEDDHIVLRRRDSVPVQVVTGAPGARTAGRATLTAKLRVPRVPRVLGLKAVRRGKRVVVTWHGDRKLSRASVVVMSTRTRASDDYPFGTVVDGAGQHRFHVYVKPDSGDRYIQLYLLYEPDATQRRIAAVRVTKGT
jgi:hypothetical protein